MNKEGENKGEISMKQDQIHDLLFSKEIGWQSIIYDLINTDQLDPWDIDINLLVKKYLEKIQKLEEQDFFISSKVLLAAALLLRIKSEILLNEYIKSIDEILFGKKEKEIAKPLEKIDLEDGIPDLIPRSPVPRFRRITLKELVDSLDKAIITENRRIKREIIEKNIIRDSSLKIHKKIFSAKDMVKKIYDKILKNLEGLEKVHFKKISGDKKEERIISFNSLFYLETQNKIWIEQSEHFGEIHIWRKKDYLKKNNPFEDLMENTEESI